MDKGCENVNNKMIPKRGWLLLFIFLCSWTATAQLNNQNTPDNFEFFLDSSADCNGPMRNVFNARSMIKGQGSIQTGPGPTTCKISLRTEKPYEVAVFKIEIRALQIEDCGVIFTIYDGESGINNLGSYSCDFGKQPNMKPFISSGDRVSFVLQRQDLRNTRYDINIVVTPLVAGRDPGYENNNGGDYGYNYHRKFPTEAIVGIVGGLFVVIVIVIIIVTVYCYRKHNRLNKRWQQQPLAFLNTNMSTVAASDISKSTGNRSLYEDSCIDKSMGYYSKADSTRTGRTDRSRYTPPPSYIDRDDRPNHTVVERVVPVTKSRLPTEVTQTKSVGLDPVGDEEDGVGDDELIESEPEVEDSEEEQEEESIQESEDETETPHQPHVNPTRRGVVDSAPPTNQINTQSQPLQHFADPRIHSQPQMLPQQYIPYPPQQQFVPLHPVPYGMQQVPPSYPPPMYPAQSEPVHVPSVKPTDPPIYSYLVQRGYTPLDGRQSPASMSSAASHHSASHLLKNDSDTGNLASGVEFMSR